MTKNL